MTELHVYRPASCVKLDRLTMKLSVRALLIVLCGMQKWLQTVPLVSRDSEGGKTICLLFRDCACTGEDLCEMFGSELAALQPRWKIDLYGTEPCSQETVWYQIEQLEDQCCIKEYTLSGNSAETVQSLCLCLTCMDPGEADVLLDLLRAMDWKRGLAAVEWSCGDRLNEDRCGQPVEPSLYCYESVQECPDPEECLAVLSLEQKVCLWTAFLEQDRECAEFRWLYDAIVRRELENRIEWELSLYQAMKRIGYSVQAGQRTFTLCDGKGCRRYFSADSARNSERAFLKILFPLNF